MTEQGGSLKPVAMDTVSNTLQFLRKLLRLGRAVAHSGKALATSVGPGNGSECAAESPQKYREFDVAVDVFAPIKPATKVALLVHHSEP